MPDHNYQNYQERQLKACLRHLDALVPPGLDQGGHADYRLAILEKCAAKVGGYNYLAYCRTCKISASAKAVDITTLFELIGEQALHPSIILSILAAELIERHAKKSNGVYYTDFRLAEELAQGYESIFDQEPNPKIIDTACGTGILLCTIALKYKSKVPIKQMLSTCIYGVDISVNAVRGALLSLSSLTNNLEVINKLRFHLRRENSLLAPLSFWREFAPKGFSAVIGNPPWERLKLTLHEFMISEGKSISYGESVKSGVNRDHLNSAKAELQVYASAIRRLVPGCKGEIDLYMPFIALAEQITRTNGRIGLIVPGSLIRNQGTTPIREFLCNRSKNLGFKLYDNKPGYFSIDSRFKFLILNFDKSDTPCNEITLQVKCNDGTGQIVSIAVPDLKKIRPDLSIPEVAHQSEWVLFRNIAKSLPGFGQAGNGWDHKYHREVDMTFDRKHFLDSKRTGALPLVEGRMVHQFKVGVKSYVSGEGRRAIWTVCQPDLKNLRSQFYMSAKHVPIQQLTRVKKSRVAFCDITGQTNERTILASLVPANAICGNKVPTIEFINSKNDGELGMLWLGIANSFVFDWLSRRVITTNVNFFILDSIPIPVPDRSIKAEIVPLVKRLLDAHDEPYTWHTALLRAKIDAFVACHYKLSYENFRKILADFQGLDKLQTLDTVGLGPTKTLALFSYLNCLGLVKHRDYAKLSQNLKDYKAMGLVPYVPNQFSNLRKPDLNAKPAIVETNALAS